VPSYPFDIGVIDLINGIELLVSQDGELTEPAVTLAQMDTQLPANKSCNTARPFGSSNGLTTKLTGVCIDRLAAHRAPP
tara:strand:- start:2810 stop:3046 length:237 start_codon:yes stop_codon:yes gene_type:complete